MSKTSTTKKVTSPISTEMNANIDNTTDFPYEPGVHVINNILNYSKALSIRKSSTIRQFEIVLN
ncbi:MAG: hypothetical protein K0Q95_973 [Bacteroidota bacterium]|jgi:hypothetical protein|nr:hypothetical protein [Bacteroidota bacterium]